MVATMITSQPLQYRRINLDGRAVAAETLSRLRAEAAHSLPFDNGREQLSELCRILDQAILEVEALRG